MNYAHVDSKGVVVNVVIANDDKHHVPEGLIAVPCVDAAPGHTYADGKFHRPKTSKDKLLSHAHSRYNDVHWYPIWLPDERVVVMLEREEAQLDRLARRATKNPDFETFWPQPKLKSIKLSGKDVLDLDEAVMHFKEQQRAAYEGVQRAIENGDIKDHYGVDNPPSTYPQWPPRYDDAQFMPKKVEG